MKLLAISEHYYPRLGGTVNYVHETLNALAALGIEAELLVPGPLAGGAVPEAARYRVTALDAGYPERGDPPRAKRQAFCRLADTAVKARLSAPNPASRPDLVHVLFGLFVLEVLDSEACRVHGVPVVATVHNLPPMECGRILPGAGLAARLRERTRLAAVGWKNTTRLRRHQQNLVIAPSAPVATLLRRVMPGTQISVIGHGPTSELETLMTPPLSRRPAPATPLRLLTVGGLVPHKRQHLIPEVASRLQSQGVALEWDVAGPTGRVAGYHDVIAADLVRRGLRDTVRLHPSVPFAGLAELYDRANLYVQPSTQEGFCITALDAASAGLPVIGSPAGALPEIASASGGRLVASDAEELARAIAGFVQANAWPDDALAIAKKVRSRFSWEAAADVLVSQYQELLFAKASDKT